VGVVYTTVIHSTRVDVAATVGEVAPISAPVKTAVVLNANDGYFDSVKDSTPEGAPSSVRAWTIPTLRCCRPPPMFA